MGGGDGRIKKLATQRGAGDIPAIIRDLKVSPQEGKAQLAHLLDVLATSNDSNPGVIVNAGGVKLLVEILSSGTDAGQIHAAATLATIAAAKKEYQQAIVNTGAITPLVSLLRTGSNKAQIYAASAVASLSDEPESKELFVLMVVRAGAIAPLVRLVRGDVASEGQVFASNAIANLSSQNIRAQNAIHAAGAVPLLLKLLECGKAQVSAANALGMLMSPGPEESSSPPGITPANSETQEAIASGGAIAPLLSLLNGMNIQGQVHAAAALSNLARGNESTQNQIVHAGGIGSLIELLKSRSTHAMAQGASALAHIARFNQENQKKIAEGGGMHPLVSLLSSSNSLDVQAMAALAITELCRNNTDNKSSAAEEGAVTSLVEQLKVGQGNSSRAHEEVKAEAAGAIWVLSEDHEDNKRAFAQKVGIKPTTLLLASEFVRAQRHAGNALTSLGRDNKDNQKTITELLVGLLGSGNPQAKSNSAITLWRIVKENPDSQKLIAEAGPTSDLIALLKEGTEQAKEYALWSLSLSIEESNQKTLLEEDGITPLVAALRAPLAKTRQQAAAALAALAMENSKAQTMIAQAGSVKPLIAIVKQEVSDQPEAVLARENAAAALAQLAFVPGNRDEIVEAGGIEPLVLLLREGDSMSQKFAAAAIARLATNHEENQRNIAKAGAILSLVSLLDGERGDEAQEEAAGALFELADDAGNRIGITESNGIGPLVVLLGSSNSKARRHAEGALVRLSIESKNRVIIIEKLVGMLNDTGKSAQEQAAAALANLASDSAENRNSIVDAGGIAPLIALFKNPEKQSHKAKENSVSAISKLAFKSHNIQMAIARAGGIPLLAQLLISSANNVKDLSAAQLCSIAASAVSSLAEDNKDIAVEIAEAGAVAPLVGMLGSPSPELQGNAAGALAQLSHNSTENQAAVARTGAIAPLCTLVREGTPEVKEHSAAALWALTHENNANKATVAKLGGIEPLVVLLVTGGTQNSWEQAVGALGSLCSKHVENRELIAKLIVARLNSRIAMVQTPGGAVRVLSSVSKLCNGSNSNQLSLAKAGCVPSVIMWLSGGFDAGSQERREMNADAQCEAARALLAIATNNEPLQGLIVRSNGIPPLISLVSNSSLAAQAAAVRTLWHLSGNSESGKAIADAGGMQPLCAMLSSEDVPAQELAAVVISRLLKSNSAVSLTVAKVGGIVPLVRLLKKGSPTGQQQAVIAIAEVAMLVENRTEVANAGGIPCLNALLTSNVMGTPEVAARALANLARDGETTPDDGGAPPDENDGEEVIRKGSAPGKTGRERRCEMRTEGVIKRLIQMMQSVSLSGAISSKKMWELVANVIGVKTEEEEAKKKEGMTTNPVASEAEVQDGGSKKGPDLEKMIGLQEQAAATISDLAYGDMEMQDAIIKENGIPPLLNLLRNGSKVSQEHAARAIWHLCAATDNQGLIVDNGAVAELVALSRVGSARAQELAAAVISDLAKGAIMEREKIMKQKQEDAGVTGAAPVLQEAQEEAGAVSTGEDDVGDTPDRGGGTGGAQEPEKVKGDRLSAIAGAGGVIPLVGLVTNGNEMGKERAVSALLHLSVDAVNQIAIARAGGIPPIAQLLDDGTQQAHVFAIAALARLAHNNTDNQAQIAKKLVGLLSYPSEGAQRRSAHVLWQLAESNPNAPNLIVNAGAISPLVALLGTGSIEAKEEAVGALTCLAHNNPSNQLAIASGLVGLLGSGTAEAQEQVTQMLIKFAQHPDNRTAIASAGAIKRLIIQLRGGAESSLKAQELAAAVLTYLAGDSQDNVAEIAAHGGIKPLVSLLVADSPEAQARAASALAFMTRLSKEIQTSCAKEGAIEPLVNLLQPVETVATGGSLEGRSQAAAALWSLSTNNMETTNKIAESGAIVSLVKLLHEQNADAQKNAAGALSSLSAGNRPIQEGIADASGIAPLVQLLGPGNEEVFARAANALSELVREYPINQTAVAEAGGIKLLVALLKGDVTEEAHAEAASALWSLSAKHAKNQSAIANEGGLAPLCALLGRGNAKTQHEAAGALAAIALDNPSNESTIATMLVELLNSEDLETCTKAAIAISRLARSHPSNQVAIAKVGGVRPLVAMVSTGYGEVACANTGHCAGAPHDGSGEGVCEEKITPQKPTTLGVKQAANIRVRLQKEAAAALWSMAFDNGPNQTAIADQGGVPSLIALLSHARSEVHRDSAGALWSLAPNVDNQKLIAKCNGITPLVTLLTDGNPGAQETAAGALHTLAALPNNRVAIADGGGVPALVALFETGTDEAKVESAGALSSMVVDNQENQSAVAQNLVGLLQNEKSSSEAQEHVTQLLYSLALDPENRGALSKWGAIPALAVQLRDGTPSSQTNAAAALSQIALKSPQHRVQVTAQLIKLLGSDDVSVRQRAFTALQDMAAEGGSDSRMTVQMAGGIDRFVALLKDGSLEAQEYALWLLWQSTDVLSKRSIAMAHCAKPIMTIVLGDVLSEIAKEHAASVLSGMISADLIVVDESIRAINKADVIETGGVIPLVKLLRTGSMGAKRHAAMALSQLARNGDSSNKDTQKEIVEAGAIQAMVGWLSDASLGPPAMAARAFAELSTDNFETQTTIVEAGAIPPLIQMMTKGSTEEQKWAAGAVAAMAEGNTVSQIVVTEEHGIPPLVELLKREAVGPHENATRALWHLSSTHDNQLAIAAEGCLPPLVANLWDEVGDRAKWAAAALQALSSECTENQVALARVGAIPPLVVLLGSESVQSQLYAQGALLNIAVPSHGNRAAVVEPLVDLLEVRNAAAQMKAAESLAMLAGRSVENRTVIAQAAAIPPLVRLLGDGRNVNKSQVHAAAALSDLARDSGNKQSIVTAGGVEPLVAMLLSLSDEAQRRASAAVWQLSMSTSAQQLIADANGIQHLVALLASDNMAAANHAASALWHLESIASTKTVIIAAGGIAALVSLLARTESSEAKDAIAALLSDLARERGGAKAAIVKMGGLENLVKLLETGSSVAHKHAACALWGLTSEPAYVSKVIRLGAVPLLIKLLAAGEKAQGYAAAALLNLAHDADGRTQLMEGGAIEPLTTISQGPENWLRAQAVGVMQLLKVDVPVARSMAQELALRLSQQKHPYEETKGEQPKAYRGWDSTYGNPRFNSEAGEFDHLLRSPRNDSPRMLRNAYKQEVRKRFVMMDGPMDGAAPPSAPLDFDMPNSKVAEALAAHKASKIEATAGAAPAPATTRTEGEVSVDDSTGTGDCENTGVGGHSRRKKNKKTRRR